MNHALYPLGRAFPAIANVFVTLDGTRAVSATNALLAALTAPCQSQADAGYAYHDLARVAHELTNPLATTTSTSPTGDVTTAPTSRQHSPC